jgi:DNA-binding transcriptional MerR regulator
MDIDKPKTKHGVPDPGNGRRGMDDPATFAKILSTYSVQDLAKIAGTNRRTLQHYDDIGLLKPQRLDRNNYRRYTREDLLRLQQIMFFRELDFPLAEIMNILNSPQFDMKKALEDHRNLIGLKRKRLGDLIKTIDKTIISISALDMKNKKLRKDRAIMPDKELYSSFSTKEVDLYAEEAKERWGHTIAYKQSQERYGKMTKEEKEKIGVEGDTLMRSIAECFKSGESATSSKVQKLIARHYEGLRTFYDPNPEMYKGLAEMYVADPRFTAFYDKYAVGLAPYMKDGMIAYAESF